jgi:hypothetical protein
MFISCKKFQTCKQTLNFKREVQKHLNKKNNKELEELYFL